MFPVGNVIDDDRSKERPAGDDFADLLTQGDIEFLPNLGGHDDVKAVLALLGNSGEKIQADSALLVEKEMRLVQKEQAAGGTGRGTGSPQGRRSR